MLNRLIYLQFSHSDLSPFLKIGTITDSHQSLRICSFFRIDNRSFCLLQLQQLHRPWRRTMSARLAQFLFPSRKLSFLTTSIYWRKTDIYQYCLPSRHKQNVQCGNWLTKLLPKELRWTFQAIMSHQILLSPFTWTFLAKSKSINNYCDLNRTSPCRSSCAGQTSFVIKCHRLESNKN